MPAAPLVTVGMSVRNAERTLAAAVQSILWQSLADWELLVTDDGSSDRSRPILESFGDARIRLIGDRTPRGLAARLNEIVGAARGRYFARMDADDIAFPARLAEQAAYLEAHPGLDLIGCGAVVIGPRGEAWASIPVAERHEEICAHPWSGFPLAHPTWFGRAAWFKANPYRADWPLTQDQELLLRTHDASRFGCVPRALLGYRFEGRRFTKRLASRYWLSRAIWREASRRGRIGAALQGIALQMAKSALDALQVGLGLEDWAMRKRLAPLPGPDRAAWGEVRARLELAGAA